MKNMFKLIGLISLAAIISFAALSLTGCDDGGVGVENPIAPTITTATLPKGRAETPYTATLAASGDAPITWSLKSGTLPAGLSLSGNTISGTPTVPGTSTFTVTATNAAGSNDKELSITITPSGKNKEEAIPLIENVWEDGNLPTSSDVQWFSFTATASTQYIHAAFGTLTFLYVQLYDSSGTAVGSETSLYSSSPNTSQTLTSGQTYYIKVKPSISVSGTYRIAFNTTFVPPGISPIPLTENTWTKGKLPTSSDVQWFSFTAAAVTQWIHVSFGTPTQQLYVQVYDSSGTAVGSETQLGGHYPDPEYTSRTLVLGQTYYIRVKPYPYGYGGGSGDYRIVFNTSIVPPGFSPIPLTENTWTTGNLPTGGQQWFSFTATANTQWIHVDFGTLTDLFVQVYDSGGTAVVNETRLYSSTTYISQTLVSGQTYYIRVRPNGIGTYKIRFNTEGIELPNVIPLTVNQWTDGNLPTSDDVQWFSFTATASTQYIHAAFGTLSGNSSGIYVQVYNSGVIAVGSETRLYSYDTNTSQTLTAGQTYYIRVRTESNGGTYRIAFNTSSSEPPTSEQIASAIPLTLNKWENSSTQSVQWFSFIATASTQYIHTSASSASVSVQVYTSAGATVGSEAYLYYSIYTYTNYTSQTLVSGQTYYIRVRGGGSYQIGFNTSNTPPTQ